MATRAEIILDLIAGPFAKNLREVTSKWAAFRKSVFTVGNALKATFAGYAMMRMARFAGGAIQAAGEQAQVEASLAQAMKAKEIYTAHAANELIKYADALQWSTTFQDEQIIGVMRSLVGYGLQGDQLKQATQTVLDWTAAGYSMEGVTEGIGKAMIGNLRTMAQWGIQTEDASGKTLAFSEILKNLAARWPGQAARQAATDFGQISMALKAMGELKETAGVGFGAAIMEMAEAFKEINGQMGKWNTYWSQWLALNIEGVITRLVSGFSTLGGAMLKLYSISPIGWASKGLGWSSGTTADDMLKYGKNLRGRSGTAFAEAEAAAYAAGVERGLQQNRESRRLQNLARIKSGGVK